MIGSRKAATTVVATVVANTAARFRYLRSLTFLLCGKMV